MGLKVNTFKGIYSIFYIMDLCWDDKNLPYFKLFLESSYFYYIFHTRLILNESAIKSDQLGFGPKALALQTHENISFKYVHCCVEIILILYPTFKFMIFIKFLYSTEWKLNRKKNREIMKLQKLDCDFRTVLIPLWKWRKSPASKTTTFLCTCSVFS